MKSFLITCFILVSSLSFSQQKEKEIKSEVAEVTVYLENAQITRKKTISLEKGETILKFVGLSPYIQDKSVRVKLANKAIVLAVNTQKNYLKKNEKLEASKPLEKLLNQKREALTLEKTYISILKEEINFLTSNKIIGGKNEVLSADNYKNASDFFGRKLSELRLKSLTREKKRKKLIKEIQEIESQLASNSENKKEPTAEIIVKVLSESTQRVPFEISYLVNNAGWYPTYDIRAKDIDSPIQLTYKANVKQNTKVHWNRVKLKFSSATPNVSGTAPQLQTHFLNYNSRPPQYLTQNHTVSGIVTGKNNAPLPGVNVIVQGTTIGTTTDFNGSYSISIPTPNSKLVFSYIGFKTQTRQARGNSLNIRLEEDDMELEEIVVTRDYDSNNIERRLQKSSAMTLKQEVRAKTIPTNKVVNQTSVDFEIKTPYSIKSDNKNYTVDMEVYNLKASYNYFSIPKIEKGVFLIASVTDWEKYNLMEAEAGIYFENTYVGKSLIDLRSVSDTLKISLGRDKNVVAHREKVKNYTKKQFLGTMKEETKAWKINIRNKKRQTIQITVLDQIPVATLKEITVDLTEKSGAKHHQETGRLTWKLKLKPSGEKNLKFNYKVKYPKNKILRLE